MLKDTTSFVPSVCWLEEGQAVTVSSPFLGNAFLFGATETSSSSTRLELKLFFFFFFFASHFCRMAGSGAVQGTMEREADQDSAGGSTSSSTGFGSFFKIDSASSYI